MGCCGISEEPDINPNSGIPEFDNFFKKLKDLVDTMNSVCNPIFDSRDKFFESTEMNQVEHATTKHGIQALFYAVSAHNPGEDITKII